MRLVDFPAVGQRFHAFRGGGAGGTLQDPRDDRQDARRGRQRHVPLSAHADGPRARHGEALLEPGSSAWFRAALQTRAEPLGLRVRFVARQIVGGWDPAASYRSFDEQVDRWSSS